jgi:DNA-binding MarR family transcriptional regulator
MARQESRLQKEIRQTKPFSSIYQEATLSVMKTADVLRRRITRVLEPFEITPQQYNVLRIVRGAGEGGIPTLAIGERLLEETPGMTRLLDRLEFKGLVRRERCEKDRRQVLCYMAPAGEELLARLDPLVLEADDYYSSVVTVQEAELLVELLEKIREKDQLL